MAAYIPVPRDLTRVKSKILFNLTKRQLLCFGAGALIGVPSFFLLKAGGNTSMASQIEKAETAEAVKEVSFGFMETENLGLSREQCQKFWEVVEQKEASLSPPSALADLQAKKEKSEKEMSSKPKTKTARKKQKKQTKEESR